MTLDQKEGIVERFTISTKCIGTEKTNTEFMITFFKEGSSFDYFDVFFSKEKLIQLRNTLDYFIEKDK